MFPSGPSWAAARSRLPVWRSWPVRTVKETVENPLGSEERAGKKRLTYIGNSEVVNPAGNILRRAPGNQVDLGVVEIDPVEAREKRITPFNDLLAARRPEHYSS